MLLDLGTFLLDEKRLTFNYKLLKIMILSVYALLTSTKLCILNSLKKNKICLPQKTYHMQISILIYQNMINKILKKIMLYMYTYTN